MQRTRRGGDGVKMHWDELNMFANELEQLAQQPTVSGEKILLLMEKYSHHFGWVVTA